MQDEMEYEMFIQNIKAGTKKAVKGVAIGLVAAGAVYGLYRAGRYIKKRWDEHKEKKNKGQEYNQETVKKNK